ncbi:integrase, catalytic region, zinc finger, CCHC-type containing protein [Tanacetum coccineum]
MKGFETNDQADYYSEITSITVNGKNAYELKGKFIDLHKNAFSGTNREDAVEHIEYFLKIVDPIDLPNVNQDKLRIVVFPISLFGDAWRWFDGIKGSITRSDEIKPTNEETSDLEETDHDDEQEIGEIFRIETNLFDYETSLCENFKEFNYLLTIDPMSLLKILKDLRLMKNIRTIRFMSGIKMCHGCMKNHRHRMEYGKNQHQLNIFVSPLIIKMDVQSGLPVAGEKMDINNKGWKSWENFENTNGDRYEREYENDQEDEERCELFADTTQELSVCIVRRFEMIKYSFRQGKEYVAVKEDEYEDLTSISEDACRSYQEIFRMMDEGWMVTRAE